jgi:ribose 5-phosphate isomerase B
MSKVILGADHRGFALKEDLKMFLEAKGYEVLDAGAHVIDHNDDYPDFAYTVAQLVVDEENARGIVICGSGEGVAIVANKVRGIRASACYSVELAREARAHGDNQVISLSADRTDEDTARAIALTFLETEFGGEERHVRRIAKIADIEDTEYGNHSRAHTE